MIVGTAGHIDHGKTSLVRRLTGVDTDRLKEEKARGISIDLGFAYWPRPGGEIVGFVDVPGHEGLVHNMLAGATGIDFVMLVIAADDGVMPQTREHLAIMDLLGLEHGVVALNKCDLVGEERLAAVTAEVAGRAGGHGPGRAPRSCRSRPSPAKGLDALGRAPRCGAGQQRRHAPAGRPLPPGRRPLLHAGRPRHGRHRHRAVGRGRASRTTSSSAPRGSKRACARSTRRTSPSSAARPASAARWC